jgi:type I restriction enzyme S subunit
VTIKLQPHKEYKPSVLRWLDQTPAHWEHIRLKYAATIQTGITLGKDYGSRSLIEYPYLRVANVQSGALDLSDISTIRVPDAEAYSTRLRDGDVLMTEGGDIDKLGRGAVWRGEIDNCLHQNHIFAVRPKKHILLPEYLTYLLASSYGRRYFEATAKKTTNLASTNRTTLGRFPLPLPPAHEQLAIVQFINHLDRLVARYVRAQKLLLVLLDEQKQAIISRAITTGLDPNVRLKPSGVTWLGDVPSHWEVSRSQRLFSVRTELAHPDDVQLSATQAYGVIPQADFERKVGRKVVRISMHLEKRRHVEKDDFVISMRSFQGGLERAWNPGAIRSSYVILKPGPYVDIDYFSYVFKSPGYIRALQATADFIRDGQDLTFENFRRVDLPLIPLEEQKSIANWITHSVQQVNAEQSKLAHEIELLREYRARLITDIVTGQLDVREAAASLSDEGDKAAEMSLVDAILEEVDEADTAMDDLAEDE